MIIKSRRSDQMKARQFTVLVLSTYTYHMFQLCNHADHTYIIPYMNTTYIVVNDDEYICDDDDVIVSDHTSYFSNERT